MTDRHRVVRFLATGLLTLLAVPVVVVAPSVPVDAATTAPEGALRRVGALADPPWAPARANDGAIAAVDAAGRRMYYVYSDKDRFSHVMTYDLTARIPKPIAVGRLAPEVNVFPPSPYSVATDTKRKQLVFITGNLDVDGHGVTLGNPSISVYSDRTHQVAAKWDIVQKLPGFYPFGVTYSAKDDRLYLVGEFAGSQYVAASTYTFGSKAAGVVASVVAMDPDTGDVIWARQLPVCQQALFTLNVGGLIARSTIGDAVYFACVTGGTATGKTYPGQAGLVRLNIDPKAANSADAAQFTYGFYAISGNYFKGTYSGIAAFDSRTDRFFLQSLAPRTPGAWVFDGRLSAWVGFVSAPNSSNRFVGLNETLGHLYIGTNQGGRRQPDDGIVVADVRQTPVPAGEFVPLVTDAFIVADSGSRRLFVLPSDNKAVVRAYEIYEDLTPVTNGNPRIDYDDDTTDTPDTPGAQVFYAGTAAGYGMQAILVGGTGGVTSGPDPGDIPNVAPGTRAVMAARLGNLDLRAGGATAATQAALADINTVQQYEGETKTAWPYPVTSCLDSGGEPSSQTYRDDSPGGPANGGSSGAECDLGKNTVKAWARMGASGSGTANATRSMYDADAYRNTTEGIVVRTRASADGVTFEVAGGYNVRIGRVAATSRSVAHGRPGTTSSTYTRSVEAIQITDSSDKVVQSLPGCSTTVTATAGKASVQDTCAELGDRLSRVLPNRLKVSFPMPEVTATPRGAFAGVEQSIGEYFQQRVVNDQGVIYRSDSVGVRPNAAAVVEVYHDSTERSRTVAVLAATQSNALFTVVPAYQEPPYPPLPTDQPTASPDPGDAGGTGQPGFRPGDVGDDGQGGPAQPTAAPPGPQALPSTQLTGFLFLRRSARDAILLVLLAGLLMSGAGTYWRRRRLVQVLVTIPGKEAL